MSLELSDTQQNLVLVNSYVFPVELFVLPVDHPTEWYPPISSQGRGSGAPNLRHRFHVSRSQMP